MAEAAALLGVVGAGIQCAQAGLQVLIVGSSLRAKIQDAPEKVNQWLRQIEQLVALAESIKQTPANRLLSSLEPPAMPCSSAGSTASWIESALLDCTNQARAVQDLLKDMTREVDDGRGRKLWKSILTLKREARITSALDGIERQKNLLNMWLSQNNLRQLDALYKHAQDFQDGIEKVDRYMQDSEQSFCKEFQQLSTALENSTSATTSGIEGLINAGTVNAKAIGRQLQHHHSELQLENSAMHSKLQNLTREMRIMKREVKKLASFQTQVSHAPSLLQKALQEQSRTSTEPAEVDNNYRPRKKRSYKMVPQMCSCRRTSSFGFWSLGAIMQMTLSNHDMHAENCPLDQGRNQRFATIRCWVQTAILNNLLRLSFEATNGAGGFSIGVSLRTQRMVERHFLEPFFWDLYGFRSWKRYIHEGKPADVLVKLVERKLLLAFSSGKASLDDVDRDGNNLIHLQIKYGSSFFHRIISERIIKMLVSMGCRTDVLNNSFCTPLQLMIKEDSYKYESLEDTIIINEDIVEWTGLGPYTTMDGISILNCMRRWPESREVALAGFDAETIYISWSKLLYNEEKESIHIKVLANNRHIADWGYPYISDIVLRKSKGDLELFIARGMKPVEVTSLHLTPLHLAAAANWAEGVSILLTSGADKYTRDSGGLLPIDYALRNQCPQTIELLLNGNCEPYFPDTSMDHFNKTFDSLSIAMLGGNRYIQNTLIRTLAQTRTCWRSIQVYYLLMRLSFQENALVDDFFAGGVHNLEARYMDGTTLLMRACQSHIGAFVRFFLDRGASPFTPHRDSAITAGYFLCGYDDYWQFDQTHPEDNTKLLQAAFSIANTVESDCRCSPEGFTPITAMKRAGNWEIRQNFEEIVRCLRWPTHTIQEQARALVIGEIFDQLQMTHTCLNINKPSRKICQEDRLEIEEEEEEFYKQLQELMTEYDLEQARFNGGPLEYLDFFFEMHGFSLPSVLYFSHLERYNEEDKDILGPGTNYRSCRRSFKGKTIFYAHKEEVIEEDMLSLLFR